MLLDLSNQIDQKKAKSYFEKLMREGTIIELKKVIKKRSLTLNSYMHVCITLFAIEFGYTIEEAKTLLKRLCPFMIYTKNGGKFLKRTRDLDNKECSEFVGWVRNYSSKQGLYIPDVEEYKLNQFNIDKEISKHKEYL